MIENLKEILHYDQNSGVWTWLVQRTGPAAAGSVAGTLENNGYIRISIAGVRYPAHRLAWLYMTGKWPEDQIDHINRNRSDNRWVNLREASNAENQRNSRKYKNNTSGFKGVSWQNKRWKAHIRVNGKLIHLGYYPTAESAHAVYIEAARLHFGEFSHAG